MLGFLRVPPVLSVRFLGALVVLASNDSIKFRLVHIMRIYVRRRVAVYNSVGDLSEAIRRNSPSLNPLDWHNRQHPTGSVSHVLSGPFGVIEPISALRPWTSSIPAQTSSGGKILVNNFTPLYPSPDKLSDTIDSSKKFLLHQVPQFRD
ncbi:hypothetical protein IW261DRAFT_1418648 [Armillaria novae-zelandiae]|uniref:Uncharacterized protein n=1 Tax=Armillaria novae-zelandiae TaxID=153914 RepID=A0AA39PD75_9AGAR|nr:hypothetical protein IW261DRAFT_1418648 [Armillaria novae-zelandiae]